MTNKILGASSTGSGSGSITTGGVGSGSELLLLHPVRAMAVTTAQSQAVDGFMVFSLLGEDSTATDRSGSLPGVAPTAQFVHVHPGCIATMPLVGSVVAGIYQGRRAVLVTLQYGDHYQTMRPHTHRHTDSGQEPVRWLALNKLRPAVAALVARGSVPEHR